MPKTRSALLAATVLVAGIGLSGCSSSKKWCEHDATDRVVSDSYCKNKTPGYEWESGSSKEYKRHKRKK
ncbi:hypothetical protein [Actinomadura fibrosa]|uniref:Lipoprotein n=1 Tax=Actinomadura fibrosa TaxID=111802 RepID=A0ABW2XHZ7_9ACTN|nr:hypothetical protein [Actinomadura fibrosa]